MTEQVKTRIIRTLEDELLNFDQCIDSTESVRGAVLDKLTRAVNKINIDELEIKDPKAIAAVTMLTSATLKALSDTEATSVRRVNTKIKHQDQKRADATSELVTELYRKLASNQISPADLPPIDLDQVSASLDEQFAKMNQPILDTELREDPTDLS